MILHGEAIAGMHVGLRESGAGSVKNRRARAHHRFSESTHRLHRAELLSGGGSTSTVNFPEFHVLRASVSNREKRHRVNIKIASRMSPECRC